MDSWQNSVSTWWSVPDFDQLQVVCSLLQCGLQDLLVLLLLLQQILQQPAGGPTETAVNMTLKQNSRQNAT